MKVNIWERKTDIRQKDPDTWERDANTWEKGGKRDSIDYLYHNYRPAKSSIGYSRFYGKRGKENRWVLQLLVSVLIAATAFGLFKFNVPFAEPLRNGLKYLMTAETDVAPAFYQIVHLASQAANVEWPLVDDVPHPASTTVTEAPGGTVLLLPVSGKVIRTYGWMIDPVEKVEIFHEGIDIAAPAGTKVKASADGQVIHIGEKEGLGRSVLVKNDKGELVRYANLEEILVKEGQKVKAEDAIAVLGLETDQEPHVHFEVIINGRPVDPLTRMGVDLTRVSGPAKK